MRTILKKLFEIYENYDQYLEKILKYPFNSDKMCFEYLTLFENLIENRDEILANKEIKNLR